MEPPYDAGSEDLVVAAMLMSRDHVATAKATLSPADFHQAEAARIFAAVVELYDAGRYKSGDDVCVALMDATRNDRDPLTSRDLSLRVLGYVGWPESAVRIVARDAVARRFMAAAIDVRNESAKAVLEPAELKDFTQNAFADIEVPADQEARLANLRTFSEAIVRSREHPSPWVIPGLLRQGWRCVIVAGEGSGKSVLMRCLVGATAAGVHAFQFGEIEPRTALMVDLENPSDAVAETLVSIDRQASMSPRYGEGEAYIIERPEGMDLRTRSGRLDLEALVAHVRPSLLCIGPAYKMFVTSKGETEEHAVREVQGIIDDLRTRYAFAVVIEHHAPIGTAAGREIRPHGTALWYRWPELGIKLTRTETGSLDVGRWRPDRVTCTWPVRLDRGGPGSWPWIGSYSERMTHA